jgi:hypothetical protein
MATYVGVEFYVIRTLDEGRSGQLRGPTALPHTDGTGKWVDTSKMRKLVTRIKNFMS